MRKKKVAVSACILGELCRYDDISNEKCPRGAFSSSKIDEIGPVYA
jgi:uncharacterized protein YbbK (DUF523 family)